jgi:hypothetical protein
MGPSTDPTDVPVCHTPAVSKGAPPRPRTACAPLASPCRLGRSPAPAGLAPAWLLGAPGRGTTPHRRLGAAGAAQRGLTLPRAQRAPRQ